MLLLLWQVSCYPVETADGVDLEDGWCAVCTNKKSKKDEPGYCSKEEKKQSVSIMI